MPVKIYIVEDHPVMREMLREFFAGLTDPEADVCGEASTGEAALERLADVEADLVFVDVSLPGMSGIEFVEAAQARRPGLPCVMFSGHGEAAYARRALAAGARGYILKGDPYEVAGAIRQVLAGEVYLSERLQSAGTEDA